MDNPEDEFDNTEQEPLVLRFQCFIPENEYGIEEGYYIGNALVQLLRDNKELHTFPEKLRQCEAY